MEVYRSSHTAEELEQALSGTGGAEAALKSLLEWTIEDLYCETATKIKSYRTFMGNSTLKKVNLPNVTEIISQYIFSGCSSLVEVNLPKLETMDMCVFEHCTSLTELTFPRFYAFSNNFNFRGCTNLKKIDFQRKDNPIGQYSSNLNQHEFNGCSSLEVIIIRAEDKVWKIANLNNFTGTPFESGGAGGTVYVPQALIGQYQQATNWSALYAAGTCNFVAIEGSEYE